MMLSIERIKEYYYLCKPGIVRGNLIAAIAGFFLASRGDFDAAKFASMVIGLSLVIASGCVFNNFIDRHIDIKMKRTKNRALAKGSINNRSALIFASTLGLFGIFILAIGASSSAAIGAAVGFIFYVVIYSIGKRRSVHGTVIGSVSGAVPPVVGYLAVTSSLDWAAIILFLILVVWQMPHFYAIAVRRAEDYKAANIPVLPLEKGFHVTKLHTIAYTFAFILCVPLLTLAGYTGRTYLIVGLLLALAWFVLAIKGLTVSNDRLWARQMFLFSLLILTSLSALISFNNVLP
jgi:heme o synthase